MAKLLSGTTIYGNANVNTFLTVGTYVSAIGNVYAGNTIIIGSETVTGNITSGNVLTGGQVSTVGNITSAANIAGGNLLTGGFISATGNVYALDGIFGSPGTTTVLNNAGVVSAYGNIVSGANIIASGYATIVGTVTGGNLLTSGNVSAIGNATAGNILTIGLVSATGNVTGNYFIGNGSQLTGIIASGGAAITNGNSNVAVGANANVTVGVSGVSNVIVFAPTGEYVTGEISATGNIAGNYIFGNGAFLTGITSGGGGGASIANGTSNVNISTSNGNVTVGVSGVGNVAVFTPTGLSVTGNVYGNTFISNGSGGGISAPGNVIGGNILTGGYVSATGNVLGNYFIGNGSQLVGVLANVGTFSNGTSNISIASQNANVTVSVSGVGNVAVFAPDSINITGNITATGNIVAGGVRSTSSASAPSNPTTGDFWYNTSTNVQYRFTFDGTNYYWIDDFGATATTQPLFTGPVIFNDVSTQTDGKTGVFALKNNQANVAGVANSKQLQVTLNGAIQTPFVKTWVWPFWCVDVSFRGFKVTTLGYSATANSVVFYRPPAKGSQVSITQVNTATDSQLLRYPFSATTIAISDD